MSEIGDGLDHLRIPFEKIKFGKKLEVQGYGTVFEGEFDDQRVALKQLNITNLANIKPKLLAEILTISGFRQHPNLVALLGFCDEKSNEIILVYEYVASGNLADKMRKRLTTIQRLEICLGAARGLDYLHTGVDPTTPGIVHGNIKLSKILLNSDPNSSNFVAKVSSFGLSKIVPGKAQKVLESMDEEATEKPTKMADVYSFGVLLLEVLCGVSELVDTDDYQERHVTELVPKKMEQNKLRKIVHFDIRKEIKTEALETYAGIACRCVIKDPEARPTMAQVVEELEKALTLQGGEVSYVQIPGGKNIAGSPDETIIDDGPKFDVGIRSTEDDVKDSIAGDKFDVAGEHNGDEISSVGTEEDTTNTESVPDKTHIEHAQEQCSNNDPLTTKEIVDDISYIEKSNTTRENKDDNQGVIQSDDVQKESNKNDLETVEEPILEDKKPESTCENNDQSTKVATTQESSNVASVSDLSTNNEVQNPEVLDLPDENHSEEVADELNHLRIPFKNIKFGRKLDVRGYGSLFEGEFNHQNVALKRLNITNLGNIKAKLISAIVTVARFRQHPNLVALIGFCDEKSNELILVYEYVSSGSLADTISKHLTTIQRLEICLGAARGLEYLHTGVESVDSKPGIIHGGIKLSKILLNSDANSSTFEAKVSGFGLPKLLPGHVQIAQKSMDPEFEGTERLTKESDVYSFGVLLLEVLCGVPELVDTDDYHERHVTELVPKRLEQNILRKIVHFDIRNEITTESLETYAKIACRCVLKNPEERPTMAEVVIELEKALRLQGGKVSDVKIYGSSNGSDLRDGTVAEYKQEPVDNGEVMDSNITEEESKIVEDTVDDVHVAKGGEVSDVEILGSTNDKVLPNETVDNDDPDQVYKDEMMSSNIIEEKSEVTEESIDDIAMQGQGREDDENVPDTTHMEDAQKENVDDTNDHGSTEEITVDLNSNTESKINGENEVVNESKITTSFAEPDNGDSSNSATLAKGSEDSDTISEKTNIEDVKQENSLTTRTDDHDPENKEIIDDKITAMEIATVQEVQNSTIQDPENANAGKHNLNSGLQNIHDTKKEPELIVNIREGDFSDSATKNDKLTSAGKTKGSESKRSNSTSSESSNGDDTTPSDYLLQKSPANGGTTKTTNGSRNCYCCWCSWWSFFRDSVVFCGELFWNKLVSCFAWITGNCSSKHD